MLQELQIGGTDIPDLPALYRHADTLGVTPGWIKREQPLLWPQPKTEFLPTRWSYADIRHALDGRAGSEGVSD